MMYVRYWTGLPTESHLPDEEKEGMLIIPYNNDCNSISPTPLIPIPKERLRPISHIDGKFHMSAGFTGVNYLEYLKSTFDMLHREGQSGTPKIMTIRMHSPIIGKPGRSEMLREFILYVKGKED